jgi:integrase
MAEMVRNDYRANGLRLRAVVSPLEHLLNYFGKDCRALDLTADRVTAYVASRQEQKAANATINRSLAALNRGFTLAERAGKVARRPHVGMLGESNRRKGFFEADQFEALKAELPTYLRALVETAYITGWRIASELTTRRRQHLDLKAGWLRLDPGESKNGEGRNFLLTPRLREILAAQVEQTRALEVETGRVIPWLFHRAGEPIGSFRKTWMAACKRAGLAGRIPHDFRRTAVRNLERAGISRSAAMAMVGHKTQSIYSRYAIADDATLKEAALKLAALDTLASAPTARVVPLHSDQVSTKREASR